MVRRIQEIRYSIDPEEIKEDKEDFGGDLCKWLVGKSKLYNVDTLLAHADDGVIWGQVREGGLALSGDAFPDVSPKLRQTTLQQARLFGSDAELLVWRDGDGAWHARVLSDGGSKTDGGSTTSGLCFDEPQMLWGDHQEGKATKGFVLVADGQQGLRHAVPLEGDTDFSVTDIPSESSRPLRLGVRHYVQRNEKDGTLGIVQSRLTGLWVEPAKEAANG